MPPSNESKRRWPWYEMEVGDHFRVDDKTRQSLSSSLRKQNAKGGKQFATRVLGPDLNGIWRIK